MPLTRMWPRAAGPSLLPQRWTRLDECWDVVLFLLESSSSWRKVVLPLSGGHNGSATALTTEPSVPAGSRNPPAAAPTSDSAVNFCIAG